MMIEFLLGLGVFIGAVVGTVAVFWFPVRFITRKTTNNPKGEDYALVTAWMLVVLLVLFMLGIVSYAIGDSILNG